MAGLILRLRRLIGEPISADYADHDLAEIIDRFRIDVRYRELTPVDTIAPGGAVTYLEYWADVGDWEVDAQLTSGTYAVLTPTTSDPDLGRWTFASHQAAPVYLTGKTFDLYAAAAELLDQKLIIGGLDNGLVNRKEGDTSYDGGDRAKQIMALAEKYRGMCRPRTASMVRNDVV